MNTLEEKYEDINNTDNFDIENKEVFVTEYITNEPIKEEIEVLEEPIIKKIEEVGEKNETNTSSIVKVDFESASIEVPTMVTATGQTITLVAAGNKFNLSFGRMYFIKINSDVDSDKFEHLKVLSDMADKIDVKYVKNGYALVSPLIHGIVLKNKDRLCIVW